MNDFRKIFNVSLFSRYVKSKKIERSDAAIISCQSSFA
ncbi:hypothetical protein CPter91_5423 [Collimonas pratensis]|uniref:Uncharacterized protein n=1 Tax=Collimonas pratensis TaxID=279113 RepID=A0A127QCJ5_9BURK|nr:hypothetical protein CPter91_5423 [Collimonas pratensis]